MALLRLSALALAACGTASAAPVASGPSVPAGWAVLPEMASEVSRAAGTAVDAVSAFGEPSLGCYAVWISMHGKAADAPALADALVASLAGVNVTDVVRPTTADGALSLSFTHAPYTGRLRAHLGAGRVTALACFANDRGPSACAAACTALLGAVP
ncbi:MAG TPA: hypothetical protein VGM88_26875 [Kofleriaceae bacterium]|jgi:hypothetical protein